MFVKALNATIEHPDRNGTWDAKLGVHVVSTSHATQLFVQFQTGSWNKRGVCPGMAEGTIPIKPDWVSCLVRVSSSTTRKKLGLGRLFAVSHGLLLVIASKVKP
jgi:hypothetical protein